MVKAEEMIENTAKPSKITDEGEESGKQEGPEKAQEGPTTAETQGFNQQHQGQSITVQGPPGSDSQTESDSPQRRTQHANAPRDTTVKKPLTPSVPNPQHAAQEDNNLNLGIKRKRPQPTSSTTKPTTPKPKPKPIATLPKNPTNALTPPKKPTSQTSPPSSSSRA